MNDKTMQKIGTIGMRAAVAGVTFVTLGAAFSSTAWAQCGASMINQTGPAWRNIPQVLDPVRTAAPAPQVALRQPIDPVTGAGSITGLWTITFTSGGQVVDQGFDVWHSDGTELLNDTPPPASGNICVGVWSHITGRSYSLYHPSWTFDNNGNLNGTAIIHEKITLANDSNTFSGTFTVDVFDLTGTSLAHIDGTVAAQRITGD